MNAQIYEEASDWIVKHRTGGLDAGDKQAFDRWLRESPQHVRAYLEMSSMWEDLPSLEGSWNPDAEELIDRARGDLNVVPMTAAAPAPTNGSEPKAVRGYRRLGWLSALAASVLVLVASASWFYLQRDVYGTDVGEQRQLTLSDGSVVELNARSRIEVRYTDDERRVELLEGQALFHVAKNKQRPFVVASGGTRVRAVGTSFDVYRAKTGTVVTVVEGRVAVRTGRQPAAGAGASLAPGVEARADEIVIAAGEQVVVTPETTLRQPKTANIDAATAWARNSLVFDVSPLTEVAAEFNRYNRRPLVIEDAELAEFHVSGVFSSVDPTLLIRFLREQPELVVEETSKEIRIRKR